MGRPLKVKLNTPRFSRFQSSTWEPKSTLTWRSPSTWRFAISFCDSLCNYRDVLAIDAECTKDWRDAGRPSRRG